jgi:hypothetical protein
MTDTLRSGAALIAVIILSGAGGLAFAQQPSKPAPGTSGAERSSMDHGMMGGGMGGDMMGMMNMMRGCERIGGAGSPRY